MFNFKHDRNVHTALLTGALVFVSRQELISNDALRQALIHEYTSHQGSNESRARTAYRHVLENCIRPKPKTTKLEADLEKAVKQFTTTLNGLEQPAQHATLEEIVNDHLDHPQPASTTTTVVIAQKAKKQKRPRKYSPTLEVFSWIFAAFVFLPFLYRFARMVVIPGSSFEWSWVILLAGVVIGLIVKFIVQVPQRKSKPHQEGTTHPMKEAEA